MDTIHSQEKNSQNGQADSLIAAKEAKKPSYQPQTRNLLSPLPDSEKAVVLKQSPAWARGVVWTIIGVAVAAVVWSYFAKIELVVAARGELEPQGAVKDVQAPINGVVKEVYVKDGDYVKKGQLLLKLDPTTALAELKSLEQQRNLTQRENEFYNLVMGQTGLDKLQLEQEIARLNIPSSVATLARNRIEVLAENKLYLVMLGAQTQRSSLTPTQIARLEAGKREANSRAMAAQLEVNQLQKQLTQNERKLADTKVQLKQDRRVLADIKERNTQAMKQIQASLEQIKASLEFEKKILQDLEPLAEEGAVGRYQINKQRQAVSDRQQALTDRQTELVEKQQNGAVEYKKQLQVIQDRMTEIQQLEEEGKRLNYAISQAQQRYQNAMSVTEKEIRDRLAENNKRLSEIDSQITRVVVDNEKKIADFNSKISQAKQTLKYQEVRAPGAGIVFDLKASPGYIPQHSRERDKNQAPLLKIVPSDDLIAEVDITNKDIGFVQPGQKVDVRIDTFPFSQFGDVKGEVLSIGSDALPPDETHKEPRFPTKIVLDQQVLKGKDGYNIPLKTGMSISANIKIRENRTVWQFFTELFSRQADNIKKVR